MRKKTRKNRQIREDIATREEWVSYKENAEEAVDFQTEHDTRRKSEKNIRSKY